MSDDCNNATDLPVSWSTLVELLRYRALHEPDRRGYTYLPDGETEEISWTYQELDLRSRAIAAELQSLELSGERVLLLYPPGLEYLAAFFGCLYSKAIAVPLYPPTLKQNLSRIQAIAADAGATVALTTTRIPVNLEQVFESAPDLKALRWIPTDPIPNTQAEEWHEPSVKADELAYLQYTSGSTSTPKGVMVGHENLLYNLSYIDWDFQHTVNSVAVTWLPHFHDMGLIDGLLKPLYQGIPCYFMPPTAFTQRPIRWLQAISRYKATHSGGPNFAYELCVSKISPEERKTLDLSSWCVAYNGAEPIYKEVLEKFAREFESCGFRKNAFCPAYGLAEATLKVSSVRNGEEPIFSTVEAATLEQNRIVEVAEREEGVRTLVACGRPGFGTKVVIARPDSLTQCEADEVGEIWVGGTTVALGYWNRSEQTESSFQAYFSDTGEGPFLRTGDLGFLHDGQLYIMGRIKDAIIIRGRNFYPQDIERTVVSSHPALRASAGAAFAVEIGYEEKLVVVQELEFRQKADVDEITGAIREAIAREYEVQVYAVMLIKPGSIPKTSSGKIQRLAAKAAFKAGTLEVMGSSVLELLDAEEPENRLTRKELEAIAPDDLRPQLESYLQKLVARVLKIAASGVKTEQPITNLGLDSLKVFELKNQIEADLEVAVSVTDLFEGLSIAQLATKILDGVTTAAFIPPLSKRENATRAEHPLSFAQDRLWFLDRLEPNNPFYNLAGMVRLNGDLNVAALSQSLNEILQRHEVLRTSFVTVEGKPVQVIAPAASLNLPLLDISELAAADRDAEVQRLSAEEARSPFDLTQQPLLRAKLLRLAQTEHILLLTVHHIVFDGWSMGVFLRELVTLYKAFSGNNLPSIPTLPIQYADFATWQRQRSPGEVLEPQLAYWKQKLEGGLQILNLPTDFPRPAVQTFRGARQPFAFPKVLSEALIGLSQQQETTLFMTLLAAFKTLLYRYTGQEDIIVGSPIANRNRAEIESLIGFFVNTLVLRTDIGGNPSFKELLSRVREVALGAYAHQDLPFEKLVEELQPERDLSYSPLFQVAFVFQNGLTQTLELPGLTLGFQEVDTGTSKFDLTLYLEETQQGLIGAIEYNTDLFFGSTIARMMGHFQTLLEAIAANPERHLSEFPLLTKQEHYQLLVEWNDTQIEYPADKLIHQLFEEQVERTPDAVAVVFENQQLTYRQLNEKANQLAGYLQQLGVGPEVLVGICVERSLEMVVGLLGILKAGGAYVPLDPVYPKERIAFMLEDARVSVLLTQSQLLKTLPKHNATGVCLDRDWEVIEAESKTSISGAKSDRKSDNLAYVIYTSGSTGLPKGVAIEHRSTVTLLYWAASAFAPEELAGVLASTSVCFDLSVFELFVPLSWGGSVILAENALHLPNLSAAEKVTLINTVPSAIAELLRIEGIPASVRTVNLAGEPLPNSLSQQLYQQETIQKVFNLYGPSEDTTYSTFALLKKGAEEIPSIGRPIANTQVYLLDRDFQAVPVGVPGELYIGGAGLARGYLNRAELTEERFIPNPFGNKESDRLYKTGDLARYLSDGNIEFLGRIDEQVKVRGFRIELGEIEAVLNEHSALKQSVVSVREDERGNKYLVGYIVPKEGQAATASVLRSFLKEKLPEYMVPSAFVVMEALPLTPNGKIDRRSLPSPDKARPDIEAAFAAPRTATEKLLADIWGQVLNVEKVGIHDNFFELGGHSLLATELNAKICEAFQVELPLRCLFKSPTVASLGEVLEHQKGDRVNAYKLPTIVPNLDERHQPFPLADMQQAYWIGRSGAFELSNVATHVYVEIESYLDLARFNKAWQQLIERHDMLRAIVAPSGQQQILQEVPAYQIEVLDLRGQNAEIAASQLSEIREKMSHQVLSSDRWPLFEIRASIINDLQVRLHFSFDLLIGDAWSFQIVGRELAQMYQNLDCSLVPIELSFRDYVLGEIAFRNSDVYQRSLAYWHNRIPTLPPAPELPLAKNVSAVKHPRFARRSGRLEPETWQRLKTKATQTGVTPSGILLAAFAEILTVWSKNPRFTISLTLFNRLPFHPQVNDIVGDFTSLTLLEVDNSTRDSFENRVRRLQEQLWNDLDHRYFSGVQVLRELLRIQGRNLAAIMPVVFTSTLTQDARSEQNFPLAWLGEMIYGITQTTQVFLDCQVSEEAGALIFNWDAIEELFPAGLLDDMFAAYCNFLQRLAREEETWQETTAKLVPAGQLEQLAAINNTEAPFSTELLHTLFASQVKQRSQQIAVITSYRTLTYSELYSHSEQLGHRLRQLGVRPNQLVGIVMEKGWEQVAGVLGILASGGAYVPIDPALPQERRWDLLTQAEIQIVVTQSWLDSRLEWPSGIQRICADTENPSDRPVEPLAPVQTPEDIAYVIYTSGSTGVPKGVTIDHRGAVNTILDINQRFGIGQIDRVFALSSLSFDLSVYDIFGTLAAGGAIVIPDAVRTQDPAHWAKLILQEQVTVWNSVPALMQILVDYAAGHPEVPPKSLRLVMLSGDWLPLSLPKQIKDIIEGVQVISLGGATEASIWSILYPIETVNPDWKSIPYGQPMLNQCFYVLNEALEPCPIWVTGQLYIGGIGLAKGYWRDEAKTAASFITHPKTGDRLYRTGDCGRYLPDGNIEFLGREDFQVKVQGYRIELGEIEAQLVQDSGVREAVVAALGEQQGNKRLVAYIVPEQDAAPSIEELRNYLKQKLPAYMVPSAFVMLDALPLTSNGKIDRKALAGLTDLQPELSESYLPPQTEVERAIAAILQEVFKLDKVGIHDNFFNLGGTSVHIIQVHGKLREMFDRDFPLVTLFEYPNLKHLAQYFSQEGVEIPGLQPIQEQANKQKEAIERQKNMVRSRMKNLSKIE